MADEVRIALAEARVVDAKARLIETMQELSARLEPNKIVRDMWENAKVKGADLAEDAVDAVRQRPVAVGGALAALTLFLAREPIKDAAVKAYDALTSSPRPQAKARPAAAKAETKVAKPPARRRTRTAVKKPPVTTETKS